jgi:hypothetical protein
MQRPLGIHGSAPTTCSPAGDPPPQVDHATGHTPASSSWRVPAPRHHASASRPRSPERCCRCRAPPAPIVCKHAIAVRRCTKERRRHGAPCSRQGRFFFIISAPPWGLIHQPVIPGHHPPRRGGLPTRLVHAGRRVSRSCAVTEFAIFTRTAQLLVLPVVLLVMFSSRLSRSSRPGSRTAATTTCSTGRERPRTRRCGVPVRPLHQAGRLGASSRRTACRSAITWVFRPVSSPAGAPSDHKRICLRAPAQGPRACPVPARARRTRRARRGSRSTVRRRAGRWLRVVHGPRPARIDSAKASRGVRPGAMDRRLHRCAVRRRGALAPVTVRARGVGMLDIDVLARCGNRRTPPSPARPWVAAATSSALRTPGMAVLGALTCFLRRNAASVCLLPAWTSSIARATLLLHLSALRAGRRYVAERQLLPGRRGTRSGHPVVPAYPFLSC